MSLYQFFCNQCSWKKFSETAEPYDLIEVKTSVIFKGVPHIDPVTGETVVPKPLSRKKRYKCPHCGQIVTAKEIDDPQENVVEQMDMQKRIQKRIDNDEKERLRQIERQHKKQHWFNGREAGPDRRAI